MNPRIAILLCLLSCATAGRAQNVMITEFKAISAGTNVDWIELYNAGTKTVNLEGWYLTDSRTTLTNWAFPSTSLAPHRFLVVFADGQNLRIPGQPLHTSFGLSSSGEYLALVRPDGRTVQQDFGRDYPPQERAFSYGFPMSGGIVDTNSPSFLTPTPGSANPPPGPALPLVVTEIMYHPAPREPNDDYATDDFEYIELMNFSTNSLDLHGASFVAGITFTFYWNLWVIAPGERFLVVKNIGAFQSRHGSSSNIRGSYFGGSLSDSGERLALRGLNGAPGFDFTYRDTWFPVTDGHGFSLVPVNEASLITPYGQRPAWRASGQFNGSPGTDDTPSLIQPVFINEALTRPVLPYEDALELFNPGTNDVDITGWFLTDDVDEPTKFRLPAGAVVPAGGFLALDEHAFNTGDNDPLAPGFGLGDFGEEIYLFSADAEGNLTGFAHGFPFGVAEPNVTFGRYVTSTGEEHFVPQTEMTFFATNSGPKVGPVIISEIHRHPPEAQDGDNKTEFIELRNLTSQPVPLFDPLFPTNSWQLRDSESNRLTFTFPEGAVLAPQGRILVVGFAPTNAVAWQNFASSNNVTPGTPVFGPWTGQLDDAGGNLELVRPEAPEPLFVPYILVERVRYSKSLPWPLGADGTGASIHRIDEHSYGDDPANWHATAPTPGLPGGFPLGFIRPLADQTAHVGSTISFDVTAVGTVPIIYQWHFNGAEISGATNRVLWLTNVQPASAGTYSCFVSNALSAGFSRNALLSVVDTNLPVLLITTPSVPQVRVADSQFALAGTASDDTLVASVFVKHGQALPVPATGTADWSASVQLNPGFNTLRCFAVDWAGNHSLTNTVLVLFQPDPARLSLTIQGAGTVMGATNGRLLRLGRDYTLRAIPAPGHHFTHWLNWEAGILSSNATLRFTMASNLTFIANFEANAILPFAGSYNGLFHSATNPAHLDAGFFNLFVTIGGGYSGRLSYRGTSHALHGRFADDLFARQAINRAGTNDLQVVLRFTPGSDFLSGTVSENRFTSELSGHRAGFREAGSVTNFAGRYFISDSSATVAGTVTARIYPSGKLALLGRLSDRTPVVKEVLAGDDGLVPLYFSLYGGSGSAFGWLSVTNNAATSYYQLQGSLRWSRTGSQGFTNSIDWLGHR